MVLVHQEVHALREIRRLACGELCAPWGEYTSSLSATRYGLHCRGSSNPDRNEIVFLLQNLQTGPGTPPSPDGRYRPSFPGVKRPGRGVALITHPHLAPRFSTSRAVPLLPLCVYRGMLRGDLYLYKKTKPVHWRLYTNHREAHVLQDLGLVAFG
jgi:hypothetical protein